MNLNSFYPVVLTERLEETARFYERHFGFERTFSSDWYVSLKRTAAPGYELAAVDAAHETVPAAYRRSVRGLLLNFEVEDVDAEYRRLVQDGGLSPELNLRTETFGQRHFILADPNGVLIDVIQVIPTTDPEAADQYLSP